MSTAYDAPESSRQWVNVVIRGCYHELSILEFMATTISPADVMVVMSASTAQIVLLEAMATYYRKFKTKPSAQPLSVIVVGLMADMKAYTPEERKIIFNEIKEIMDIYVVHPLSPEDLAPPRAVIRFIYEKAYTAPRLQQILETGRETGSVESVYKDLTQLRGVAKSDKVPVKILAKNRSAEYNTLSSGCSWFDMVLGGKGFVRGDSYGILGHTGAGKTTLCGQIACAMSAQRRKVLIVLTEQTFAESKLVDRFWSVITGKCTDDFEKYASPDDFPAELVTAQERENAYKIQDNIIAFDMRQITSINDIKDVVAQHRPDIFIVDWAGSLANHLMSSQGSHLFGDRNLCLRAIADSTNEISKMFDCVGVVFHQLAESSGPTAFSWVDHTDASECKTFCHNLSGGIVMSRKDQNSNFRMMGTKLRWNEVKRGDKTGGQILHLNGAFSRFEHLSGFVMGKGHWVTKAQALDPGVLPPNKEKDGYT